MRGCALREVVRNLAHKWSSRLLAPGDSALRSGRTQEDHRGQDALAGWGRGGREGPDHSERGKGTARPRGPMF